MYHKYNFNEEVPDPTSVTGVMIMFCDIQLVNLRHLPNLQSLKTEGIKPNKNSPVYVHAAQRCTRQ